MVPPHDGTDVEQLQVVSEGKYLQMINNKLRPRHRHEATRYTFQKWRMGKAGKAMPGTC
jgi:hypothetical protein